MAQQDKQMIFVSRTALGRDEEGKVLQLIGSLFNAHESILFRQPVDWKAYNLLDYPTIITRPMDLSTDVHKVADKLQKQTKKMIKNYLPFVKIDNTQKKKKIVKKQVKPTKIPSKTQQPKTYLQKQQQAKQQGNQNPQPQQPKNVTQRKNLLCLMQICTKQQIGVLFLIIKGSCPQCLQYDQQGIINVRGQKITDGLLKRLNNLMQMWGISYKTMNQATNKKK